VDSTDPIISTATSTLINAGWPNQLLILGDYYLQYSLYVDSVANLEWYIIVLMPATLQLDHVGPESSYYIPIIVIMAIVIALVVVSMAITFVNWKCRMMQLTQPVFTITSLTGCALLCITCLVFLGSNSNVNCAARAYLFNFSFTIAFSPLLIKGWRVYSVFVQSWKVNVLFHGSKSKLITVPELLVAVGALLLVDVLIMCITLYGASTKGTKPYTRTVKTDNGAYADLTYCGYHKNNGYFFSMLAYKALLIAVACVLSFQIRKIADAVAGTKVLAAIVYNTLFIAVIVISIVRTVTGVELVIFASTVGVAFCVLIACAFLVIPVMTRIIFTGDKEAAAEVIDEMFNAKAAKQVTLFPNNDLCTCAYDALSAYIYTTLLLAHCF